MDGMHDFHPPSQMCHHLWVLESLAGHQDAHWLDRPHDQLPRGAQDLATKYRYYKAHPQASGMPRGVLKALRKAVSVGVRRVLGGSGQ